MAEHFVNIDRQTPLLMPVDLREWVAHDEMAKLILECVELCDLRSARVNVRGTGSRQYPPSMMLALLLYCYTHGIMSSRAIERATYDSVAVRFLCANEHPDHDTIAHFRKQNLTLFERCFAQVLTLARNVGVLQIGLIALDGTKLQGAGSTQTTRTLEQIEWKLAEVGRTLLQQAEQADSAAQLQLAPSLPPELRQAKKRQEKLLAAQAQILARRAAEVPSKKTAADADAPNSPAPVAAASVALRESSAPAEPSASAEPCTDAMPIEPALATAKADEPPRAEEPAPSAPASKSLPDQASVSDPESRKMKAGYRGQWVQGYNAQIAVDAGASGLIVGGHVCTAPNDCAQLLPTMASIPAEAGQPHCALVDKGFDNAEAILQCEQQYGLSVLCPLQTRPNLRPPAEHRARGERAERIYQARRAREADWADPDTQRLYRRRAPTVEGAFARIKAHQGFTRFRLWGLQGAKVEWQLVCLAHNLRVLRREQASAPARTPRRR